VIVASESLLRERRLECGITQVELAARAGVSRQLVAAVEAGRNVPAVDAALRLAGALATSVEELFPEDPQEPHAALGGRLRNGAPLRVGRVGDHLVAAELADHGIAGAGWAKPDGVMDAGKLNLFPGAQPAGVVIADAIQPSASPRRCSPDWDQGACSPSPRQPAPPSARCAAAAYTQQSYMAPRTSFPNRQYR